MNEILPYYEPAYGWNPDGWGASSMYGRLESNSFRHGEEEALYYAQELSEVATDAGWTDAKEKYPSEAYSDYVLEDPETGIVMTVEARGSSDDAYLFVLIYKAGQLG